MDSSSSSLSTSPDVVLTSSPSSIDVQSTSSLSSNDMIDNSDDHMFFENKVYTTESIRCCLKYKKNKYTIVEKNSKSFCWSLFGLPAKILGPDQYEIIEKFASCKTYLSEQRPCFISHLIHINIFRLNSVKFGSVRFGSVRFSLKYETVRLGSVRDYFFSVRFGS